MDLLRPCTQCARHVFECDATCPFCGTAQAADARPRNVLTDRVRGLSRAQRAALAAAAVSAQLLVGCEDTQSIAIYGAPWDPDSGIEEDEDASAAES